MPTEMGKWTFKWNFSDGSNSGSGSFECISKGAYPGVLKEHPNNPHWFMTSDGTPFFPTPEYILQGDQLAYPSSVYGPQVYDKYIKMGANLIVTNCLPVWTWNTSQTGPENNGGKSDRNILIWYQKKNMTTYYDEDPDPTHWDSDRMNLFTWKRVDQHMKYLADRHIYHWGFQGFYIKRMFRIRPQDFDENKHRWYIRYCMARLAPYYNQIWNNTWEAGSGSEQFIQFTQKEGIDPWRHLYFQVDSNADKYDIKASDGNRTYSKKHGFKAANHEATDRPVWSTEGKQSLGPRRFSHCLAQPCPWRNTL